jgi:exonuclease SbcD
MGMMRILLLADTHLGFDYAFNPRIARRRRGPDFFRNFNKALEPAFQNEVDLVVHAGDILYRSKVPARLVDMAFEPLRMVADKGVPVYVVPGNHERSNIPFRILAAHQNIHVFDEPRTCCLEKHDFRLALAGFPFIRHGIRRKFIDIVNSTAYRQVRAACYVLCMHQSVDGCTTGPHNYVFRGGDDIVDIHDIPSAFCCVVSGHMHRNQTLNADLKGRAIPAPIFYPGSIERTSFAEKDEKKGYVILTVRDDGTQKAKLHTWTFHELPARPMIDLEFDPAGQGSFPSWLQQRLNRLPKDSIVKIRIRGALDRKLQEAIGAASLRSMAPVTMNVYVTLADFHRFGTP